NLISLDSSSSFIDDVTKLLSSCNIPLSVVNHPNFIAFMEKYCGQRPPSRPTINNHLKSQSSNILSQIKENVQGKDVYISLDETRDIKDRPMTAVLMGSWM
ncbi:Putative LOC100902024, partial [Caligus rogercresseyi]